MGRRSQRSYTERFTRSTPAVVDENVDEHADEHIWRHRSQGILSFMRSFRRAVSASTPGRRAFSTSAFEVGVHGSLQHEAGHDLLSGDDRPSLLSTTLSTSGFDRSRRSSPVSTAAIHCVPQYSMTSRYSWSFVPKW